MSINEDSDIDNKRIVNYIVVAVLVVALLALNWCSLKKYLSSNSGTINDFQISENEMTKTREPAVAGIFYASELRQLDSEVEHYLSAEIRPGTARPEILIVPHAGYVYSAPVAAQAYLQLKNYAGKIKNVILVGPSHRVAFKGIAASSADEFKTPLGKVQVNRELMDRIVAANAAVRILDDAHRQEHSLEVQLPFLQKVLGRFKIVPLVYGDVSAEELARVLEPYVTDAGTVIIVSADLSHYFDYDTARALDGKTAGLIEQNRPEIENHMSCGATGINAALLLAAEKHLRPETLELANSGDTVGDRDSVVGYGAWSFAAEPEPAVPAGRLEAEFENLRRFASFYGRDLYQIARRALSEAAEHGRRFEPSRGDWPDKLFDKGAAFVTLTVNGSLRGCIGTVVPYQAVALDVAANAYEAAMEDSRFQPVKPEELPGIDIEISLLTDYEEIDFADEKELLTKIRPGVDGLIIRDGDRQGLFLPSVWEQLPGRQDFLNNLKLKAGMSPTYWSDNIKVYRFRTLEIKENEN
ncbi:MAG: AmmeMemoRadiSam system protein B [Alphaproteobacteria bacterium]|jgi:uncharacterized protein, PH0010 family|uniref:AmmeMemoRadiSam system protein B n=1 Tax=Candidatus Scatocola faecigallinarum TaxID=2840916 RepID=UPI000340E8D2|nr:predicted dioxygenase [Azospirillum sp. CAG:239]